MVGLHFHLGLAVLIAQIGRHLDGFGDDVRRRHRHGGVPDLGAGLLDGALNHLRHLLDLGDGVLDHGVLGQWLHCIALDAQMLAVPAQLQHLDGGGADVDSYQWRLLFGK